METFRTFLRFYSELFGIFAEKVTKSSLIMSEKVTKLHCQNSEKVTNTYGWNGWRPVMERPRVSSSAYSRSSPKPRPRAREVTFTSY